MPRPAGGPVITRSSATSSSRVRSNIRFEYSQRRPAVVEQLMPKVFTLAINSSIQSDKYRDAGPSAPPAGAGSGLTAAVNLSMMRLKAAAKDTTSSTIAASKSSRLAESHGPEVITTRITIPRPYSNL